MNKYLYRFIPSLDNRTGKNNKRLYDRVLKASYNDLCSYKLNLFNSYESKVNSLLSSSVSDFDYSKFDSLCDKLCDSLSIDKQKCVSYICRYSSFIRLYSASFAEQFFDFSDLFSFDVIREFLCLNADTQLRYSLDSVRASSGSFSTVFPDFQPVISLFDDCVNMLDDYFTFVSEKRISDLHASWALSRKLKKLNYDPKLC